jgi:hypothetical protein
MRQAALCSWQTLLSSFKFTPLYNPEEQPPTFSPPWESRILFKTVSIQTFRQMAVFVGFCYRTFNQFDAVSYRVTASLITSQVDHSLRQWHSAQIWHTASCRTFLGTRVVALSTAGVMNRVKCSGSLAEEAGSAMFWRPHGAAPRLTATSTKLPPRWHDFSESGLVYLRFCEHGIGRRHENLQSLFQLAYCFAFI